MEVMVILNAEWIRRGGEGRAEHESVGKGVGGGPESSARRDSVGE